MIWSIIQATPDHARQMAPHVAAADRAETDAVTDMPMAKVLALHVDRSVIASTWLVDGVPAAIFGLHAADIMGHEATLWMFGTETVRRYPMTFLRHYKAEIARMQDMFPLLQAHVDARYALCLRWLRWTGFEIEAAEPVGNAMFHRAVLLRG